MRFLILAFLVASVGVSFLDKSTSASYIEESVTEDYSVVVGEFDNPDISALAYGVFDIETGEMLFSENADTSLPIASVTKLFTAAAALQSATESITITYSDIATEGRAGKLEAGDEYTSHELIFPLLLESSNDAAKALEGNLGEIPFADKVLADGSGLSSQNKATVHELAAEVRRVYQEQPHIFDVTTLKQYVGEKTGWVNNSPVRDLPGYKGGKHGYTEAANRTLVAVFSEDSLKERELGYVLLGSDDVRSDVQELRDVVAGSVQLQ